MTGHCCNRGAGICRPLPMLVNFSDRTFYTIMCIIYLSILMMLLGSGRFQILGSSDWELPPQAAELSQNRWQTEGLVQYTLSAAPLVLPYLGLTLTKSAPFSSYSTKITITGSGCLFQTSNTTIFTSTLPPDSLWGPLLAVIRPVWCTHYDVVLDVGHAKPTEHVGEWLLVEQASIKGAYFSYGCRLVVVVVFALASCYMFVHWVSATRRSGAAIGTRSALLLCVVAYLSVNPLSLIGKTGSGGILGKSLQAFAILQLVGEVIVDLKSKSSPGVIQIDSSQSVPRRWCGECRGARWSGRLFWAAAGLLELFLAIGSTIALTVISAFLPDANDLVRRETREYIRHEQMLALGLTLSWVVISLIIFPVWALARICILGRSFKTYAYSQCRVHYIVFSFLMLTVFVEVIALAIYYVSLPIPGQTDQDLVSWYKLNNAFFHGMILGQPETATMTNIPFVCLSFVSAICFRTFESDRVLEGSSSSRAPLLPDGDNLGNSPPAPVGISHNVLESLVGECASPTLTAVRALAQCSNLAYAEDIVEELAQTAATLQEEGLDFSGMCIVRYLCDEVVDAHAFVATCPLPAKDGSTELVVIVAFRGTNSVRNLQTDFATRMVELQQPWQGYEDVRVHSGFQESVQVLRQGIINCLEGLKASTIWLTGHSLGGALATLIALDIHQALGRRPSVCTFGSPRVGNRAFIRLFRQVVQNSIRVVCQTDPIPSTPSRVLCQGRFLDSYCHVPGLIRVYLSGKVVVHPNAVEEILRKFWRLTAFCNYCLKPTDVRLHTLLSYNQALIAAEMLEPGSISVPPPWSSIYPSSMHA